METSEHLRFISAALSESMARAASIAGEKLT
jgi:hypothetical protein